MTDQINKGTHLEWRVYCKNKCAFNTKSLKVRQFIDEKLPFPKRPSEKTEDETPKRLYRSNRQVTTDRNVGQ